MDGILPVTQKVPAIVVDAGPAVPGRISDAELTLCPVSPAAVPRGHPQPPATAASLLRGGRETPPAGIQRHLWF